MKNKLKSVRSGSRIAATPQVQKQSSAVSKKERNSVRLVTLVLQNPKGMMFASFSLPRWVYARMEQIAKDRGLSMAEFICVAVENRIRDEAV